MSEKRVYERLAELRGIPLDTPESIVEHQPKYNDRAWEQYSLQELGNWVHLFAKRSTHRTQAEKRTKDLQDAQNYLDMMQAHLDHLKARA